MRRRCGTRVAGLLACLAVVAGCSSGGRGLPDPGSELPTIPVDTGNPSPTAPNAAECAAVRNLLRDAAPVFQADAGASAEQRAKDEADFYNHLTVLLTVTDGIDPVSLAVSSDASRLEQDYTSLAAHARSGDADAQAQDEAAVAQDAQALRGDEPGFDTACAIPTVLPD